MSTEAALSKKCIAYAASQDVICHKMESASMRGWPDLILVFPGGMVVFVELKHPSGSGRLSALQVEVIKRLTHQGAVVHVIDSFIDFHNMLAETFNAIS